MLTQKNITRTKPCQIADRPSPWVKNEEGDMNTDDTDPGESADGPAEAGPGEAEYAVGYGKPPRSACFRPGQSGNPGGRPKGARGLSAIVRAALLGEKLEVKLNGRRRRVSKFEVSIIQLANRAAQGQERATREAIRLVEAAEARAQSADAAWRPGAGDEIVIADLLRRVREEP
jgi:uncharacterized protein DUF5681